MDKIALEHSESCAVNAKNLTHSTLKNEKSPKKFANKPSKLITQAQAVAEWAKYLASARQTCTIGLKKIPVEQANSFPQACGKVYEQVAETRDGLLDFATPTSVFCTQFRNIASSFGSICGSVQQI